MIGRVPDRCSCGRGEVGHTNLHETTDRPGIVRVVRDGKTDQYVNLRLAVSQVAQAEAESARLVLQGQAKAQGELPRIPLADRRPTFGEIPCPSCRGSGGTKAEICRRCGGLGVRGS